ncbi:hypothetical protein SE92_16405 [Bradyrhizobium sp. AT1]|nr:hypothetical protein SE92_16405 [Bradyrhizobium sp. AT1]
MALWQFVVDLIPASAATGNGMVAVRMNRNQLDAIELNFSQATIDAIVESVGKMLPEKQSWAPSLRIWGNEKSHDIQIGFQGTAIEDVQFRINVADFSLTLVGEICALARTFDCVLATRSGTIIRPYGEALVRAITQSDAARFVSDPERYLQKAIQNDPAPQ